MIRVYVGRVTLINTTLAYWRRIDIAITMSLALTLTLMLTPALQASIDRDQY